MRAPNKTNIKKDKETSLSSSFSFFLIVSLVLSVLIYSMSPVLAIDNEKKLSIVLIDGDEVYVRSGSYHNFFQGYQLYVKGADDYGKRVWIELNKDGVSLKDDIATEGSQFVYSHDSTEVLNLTVKTIYVGADGVLVRFSPVYQYLDPKLPMPQTSNGSLPNNSSDEKPSETLGPEIKAEGFNAHLSILVLGTAFLVTGIFAGKRKKR
jgi:S-layer protein